VALLQLRECTEKCGVERDASEIGYPIILMKKNLCDAMGKMQNWCMQFRCISFKNKK
jgi:hypothetical protein